MLHAGAGGELGHAGAGGAAAAQLAPACCVIMALSARLLSVRGPRAAPVGFQRAQEGAVVRGGGGGLESGPPARTGGGSQIWLTKVQETARERAVKARVWTGFRALLVSREPVVLRSCFDLPRELAQIGDQILYEGPVSAVLLVGHKELMGTCCTCCGRQGTYCCRSISDMAQTWGELAEGTAVTWNIQPQPMEKALKRAAPMRCRKEAQHRMLTCELVT